MTLTDEEIIRKCMFFIALRTNKSEEEKINDINNYLESGGNINHVDGYDEDNSPLHIAVKRSEKDVVRHLVQTRAFVTQKNKADKTPMDLALGINTEAGREIVDILKNCNVGPPQIKNAVEKVKLPPKKANAGKTSKEILFPKRVGTSAVGGQLYETKLLSLILMRAANDKDIAKFCLATNVRHIGALDDIFFMYKVKNDNKVVVLALQAKHREDIDKGRLSVNDLFRDNSDFSLPQYFDSYLRIKDKLQATISKTLIADENVDTELNLVLYTPVKDIFDMKSDKHNVQCHKIHNLIRSGKNSTNFQFKYNDEHISFLTRSIQEERVKLLGKTFLNFIMSPKKIDMIMTDQLIRKYHVILSRKVIQIIATQSEDYITCKFSQEFFATNEDIFVLLRDTIFKETVQNYCKDTNLRKEEIITLCKKLMKEPSSLSISEIIGKIVTYEDKLGKLKLIESNLTSKEFSGEEKKRLNQDIFNVEVTSSIVQEAINIAAKARLQPLVFKLPSYFGTFDLLKKNDNKIKKQLNFMASKFKTLFECENNVIEITENEIKSNTESNESKLDYRFFEISDGIGGAVGNLIVCDNDTKMLKFNTSEVLPERANKLLLVLKSVLPEGKNIEDYRLKICLKNFPRLSFLEDEYDKMEAKQFLDRLWFYTNQAKEDEVEKIVKKEVDKFYNAERGEDHFLFRIHSDAVYLRFHDEIQKWWMLPSEAAYLTKDSEIFEKSKTDIVDSPLLTVLNIMYVNKVKKFGIEFSMDAVKALNLDEYKTGLVNVVTDSNILTGIKIKQFFRSANDYIFVDFDYVLSLPPNDYNSMFLELQYSNVKTLIVVYEPPKNTNGIDGKLKLIVEKFNGPRIIIVTNQVLGSELEKEFELKYNKVADELNGFDQFVPKSQRKFFEDSTIVFQGEDVDLATVVDDDSKYLLKAPTLTKLINKEKIEIGKSITDAKYEDIKKYFVKRCLKKDDVKVEVNTFQDIDDDVTVIIAKPNMGKATLLTHLSVEHKKLYTSSWIVRVNLSDHLNDFEVWRRGNVILDKKKIVKFMCTVALKSVNNKTVFELEERDSEIVLVSHDNLDPSILLELDLFLYYYNKRRIIFLFNGFSNACPPYEKQTMSILRNIHNDKNRLWITCSLYVHAVNVLKNVFGTPYSLEPIDHEGQKGFFYKFFSTNLKLEKLNHEQFMNVSDFFEYFTGIDSFGNDERKMMPWISTPLHLLYFVAMDFFKSELNSITTKNVSDKLKEKFNFDMDKLTTLGTYLDKAPDAEDAVELAGTPLHMYLAANYFECKVKDGNKKMRIDFDSREVKSKWDLILNSLSLYRQFLEANLQNLCGDGSVCETIEDQKRTEFFVKHKRLALLAVCKEEHLKQLLSDDEIKEVKETVTRLQTGEEKSELVDCVLNDVPRFFHAVLAEYCLLDCVIEIMKTADPRNVIRNRQLWDFVVNIFLLNCPKSVRKAFDYKLKNDSELSTLTASDQCRKIVFDLLIRDNDKENDSGGGTQSPLNLAVNEGLSNLVNVLVKSIEVNLDKENVTSISRFFDKTSLLLALFDSDYKHVGRELMQIIRDFDKDLFTSMINSHDLINLSTQFFSCINEEAAKDIQKDLFKARDALLDQLKPETVDLIRGVCDMFKNVRKNRLKE